MFVKMRNERGGEVFLSSKVTRKRRRPTGRPSSSSKATEEKRRRCIFGSQSPEEEASPVHLQKGKKDSPTVAATWAIHAPPASISNGLGGGESPNLWFFPRHQSLLSIRGRAKVEFWPSGGGVQYIRLQKSSYVTK